MATAAEYKARILGYVEGKDPVAVQRDTPQVLAQLVRDVPSEQLGSRPAPDKWSVSELLAHFAEAEIAASWRYRQMIEYSGCPLQGYDQELWHDLGTYARRDPQESLQLFTLLRKNNIEMFERLTPQQWECYGMHAERGQMSVRDLAQQLAGHDVNHLMQIKGMLGK
jgi:DinB family protein